MDVLASTSAPVTASTESTMAAHGAVMPPLYLSSNYTFEGFDQKRAYDYTRTGNPTRDALGDALAELEGGAGAVVTASGMASLTVICHLVKAGERIVAPHDCYGGTYRLFADLLSRQGYAFSFVDMRDPENVRRALRPLETAREQIAQLQQGQRSQLDAQVPQELDH